MCHALIKREGDSTVRNVVEAIFLTRGPRVDRENFWKKELHPRLRFDGQVSTERRKVAHAF